MAARNEKRRRLEFAPPPPDENIINRLPPQIMGDILLKLSSSIKTLIYCRCVCKSWYEILSDSYFTRSLVSTSPLSVLLLFPGYSVANCLIEVQKEEFSLIKKKKVSQLLDLNKTFIPGNHNLIGSCNGLLCFETGSDYQSCRYIFNPVLGRDRNDFVMLPKLYIDPSHTKKRVDSDIYGFGFCPKTYQYKVIRSMNFFGEYVYTIGTDSWRRIEDSPANNSKYENRDPGLYFNGALHWLPYKSIWCFDLYTEKFHQFPLPPLQQQYKNCKFDFGLKVFDNCLALYFKEKRNSNLKIWVMKDYGVKESWANFFSVSENYEEHSWVWNSIPLKLTKDGSLLIVYDNEKRSLVYFDLRRGEVVGKRRINGLKKRSEACYGGICIAHIATLISPKHIMKSSSPPILYN
ncbi:hypothetical protein COLO4_09909 [Corchorus olitorius]|uniref:F-box domain-containing protein n=1 Tax=Corchorus olitorius TaxID=93759 RepID=A0A1R3KAL8_9ROSI|nr:hypothetical protein COLO4_09909 [Corchorus olitorius]